MWTPEGGGTGNQVVPNSQKRRRLATHNLRRPDGFYTAGPGEALDCLLDSVCSMGGQDFVPPNPAPSRNPQQGLDGVFTPDRLSQAMGQLSLNKSPGPDNITPAMLRNGWDLILPLFTKIC